MSEAEEKTEAKDGKEQKPTNHPIDLEKQIKKNPIIFYLGVLITGFLAGIACYKGILEINNEETIIKGTYVLKENLNFEKTNSPDSGEMLIKSFYKLLNGRRFEDAWALIHRARKEEIQSALPDWQSFGKIYDTMVLHDNVRVKLEKQDEKEKTYLVAFDVNDNCPRNSIYEFRDQTVKTLFDAGLLNETQTLNTVFNDVSIYYDLPETNRTIIKSIVEKTRFDSLLSPLFVPEIARTLKLQKLSGYIASPKRDVWRHYILEVSLMPDDGDWKIIRGLYPPLALGIYGSGAKVPSLCEDTK